MHTGWKHRRSEVPWKHIRSLSPYSQHHGRCGGSTLEMVTVLTNGAARTRRKQKEAQTEEARGQRSGNRRR